MKGTGDAPAFHEQPAPPPHDVVAMGVCRGLELREVRFINLAESLGTKRDRALLVDTVLPLL